MYRPRDYYDYLREPLTVNGKPILWPELCPKNISEAKFKLWRSGKVPAKPPLYVHEEWCRRYPAKRKRLERLYRMIWGGINDIDSAFEFDHVLSEMTVRFLREDCEAAVGERALNQLDQRFALETLTTLAEIAGDWKSASEHSEAMLKLQKDFGDPIYSARSYVKAAYIAYKRSRQDRGKNGAAAAIEHLAAAASEWKSLKASVDGHSHPDVKALIKYHEIGALIAARNGDPEKAVASIQSAQALRVVYSGKPGKACGFHREGVVLCEAAEQKEKNVELARKAFMTAIKYRKELKLWRAVAHSATAWAFSEQSAINRYGHESNWLLKARQEAFYSYLSDHDIPEALNTALLLLESRRPDFIAFGADALVKALKQVDRKLYLSSDEEEVRRMCGREGFRIWIDREPHARQLLTTVANIVGQSLESETDKPSPLQPLADWLREKEARNQALIDGGSS